jgi:hypothetical protein
MDEEGPFEGIIGYSEGATIAALLLTELQRHEEEGRLPMFKCAVFARLPPMTPDAEYMVLSDQSDLMIEVPSRHVGK